MNEYKRKLLGKRDLIRDWCVACGCNGNGMRIEKHHVIAKGAGGVPKRLESQIPLLSLCGYGNNCGCHGLAHENMLHFRYLSEIDTWQCIFLDEPTRYERALTMDGWIDCFEEVFGWESC